MSEEEELRRTHDFRILELIDDRRPSWTDHKRIEAMRKPVDHVLRRRASADLGTAACPLLRAPVRADPCRAGLGGEPLHRRGEGPARAGGRRTSRVAATLQAGVRDGDPLARAGAHRQGRSGGVLPQERRRRCRGGARRVQARQGQGGGLGPRAALRPGALHRGDDGSACGSGRLLLSRSA